MHRILSAAATALLLLGAVACTRDVTGVAQPDPKYPPVSLSKDGAGLVAGFTDAPVQIELYTEPQCRHCADLQADFGDDLSRYISLGQLAVTYRPVLFSDTAGDDWSSRVENAMFVTADTPTSGPALQRFVQELWAVQGSGGNGPSEAEMAGMADKAGVPSAVSERIGKGDSTIDVEKMADSNLTFLFQISETSPSTPTVYDLVNEEVLDIYDNNWLAKLMSKM